MFLEIGFLLFLTFVENSGFDFFCLLFWQAELILFGVLSLLMGHWAIWVAKICVKRSALSSRFYPCVEEGYNGMATPFKHLLVASGDTLNHSFFQEQEKTHRHDYCSEVLFFLNPFG